jgi:hypothetical protein
LTFPQQAVAYCTCPTAAPCANEDVLAGCVNSTGQGALLSVCGTISVTADDLIMRTDGLPANRIGCLLMGGAPAALPFGDGVSCVSAGAAGVFRFPAQDSGFNGILQTGPGLVALSDVLFGTAGTILAGSTWYFQLSYSDPQGTCGSGRNLSSAMAVEFAP